jgi:hypothetical protein
MIVDTKGSLPWLGEYGHVDGRLAFRLSTLTGEEVIDVDAPLGKYVWWSFKNKHGLYQDDWRSHFYPESTANYVLRVKYEPALEVSGLRGYVYLNTGALYSGSSYR